MELGVILLTICLYALAAYLWWRDYAPNYLVALLAGQIGSIATPLWQALYGFRYNQHFTVLFRTRFGDGLPVLARFGLDAPIQALASLQEYVLPRPVFLAAWATILPAMAIFYLYRHRWWFPGYLTSLLTYVLFVLYHLLIEIVGVRQGWWSYIGTSGLPLGVPETVLAALMNGLVTLGLLAGLILTRHYALSSLLMILLPMPLLLNLFIYGVLGAPLYLVRLLQAQSWAGAIGLLGTVGLVVWGAHIVAISLARPRDRRQFA
jgi:hypothetical protein